MSGPREYPTAITGTWQDLERRAWYLYENADEQDSERELAEAVLVLLGSASPSKPASLKSPLRVAGEPVDRQTPPL